MHKDLSGLQVYDLAIHKDMIISGSRKTNHGRSKGMREDPRRAFQLGNAFSPSAKDTIISGSADKTDRSPRKEARQAEHKPLNALAIEADQARAIEQKRKEMAFRDANPGVVVPSSALR